MNRKTGVVFGLGVFFVVLAAVLQFYAAPQLVKIPLAVDKESVSEAKGATFLFIDESVPGSPKISIRTGEDLVATRKIVSDVDASSDDHVVFDQFQRVEDTDAELVSAATDRVALDRHSAEAVACCKEAVDSKPTEHEGLSYTFPLGTERKNYRFFDTLVRAPFEMRYQGTEQIDGLGVYKFQQNIFEQTTERDRAVPGSLVGQPGELTVTGDIVYSNVRTVWVEPTTGSIIKGQEEQHRVFRAPGGADTTMLDADFAFTPKTVAANVEEATGKKSEIMLISSILPPIALGLGVLLVIIGLVLVLTRSGTEGGGTRRAGRRPSDEVEPARA
jgi:hypothetical protein